MINSIIFLLIVIYTAHDEIGDKGRAELCMLMEESGLHYGDAERYDGEKADEEAKWRVQEGNVVSRQ